MKNTKTKIKIIFLITGISIMGVVYAQNGNLNLQDLKQKWQKAIQTAIKPINEKYKKALKNLEKSYTKQGDLDNALAVRKEYDWINQNENTTKNIISKAKTPVKINSRDLRSIANPAKKTDIIGKWTDSSATYVTFEFLKDGNANIYHDGKLTKFFKNIKWEYQKDRTFILKDGDRTSFVVIAISKKLLVQIRMGDNFVYFLKK